MRALWSLAFFVIIRRVTYPALSLWNGESSLWISCLASMASILVLGKGSSNGRSLARREILKVIVAETTLNAKPGTLSSPHSGPQYSNKGPMSVAGHKLRTMICVPLLPIAGPDPPLHMDVSWSMLFSFFLDFLHDTA